MVHSSLAGTFGGGADGIREELVHIWELSERWEEVFQDLFDQANASSDEMELFAWESTF